MKIRLRIILMLPVLLLLWMPGCSLRTERTVAALESLLDSLKSVHAPDDRTAIWDLEVLYGKEGLRLEGSVDRQESFEAVVSSVKSQFPEVDVVLTLLPEGESDRVVNGAVNNSVANLRAQPASRSELISQALLGTPVRILSEEGSWYLVQTPNRFIGWVNQWEVCPLSIEDLARYRDVEKVFFIAQTGRSYSEPDMTSLPVSDLVAGCLLPVIDTLRGYYQVAYPDGRQAWIESSQTVPTKAILNQPLTTEGLTEILREFNGIPYLWGGTSPKGFDCSGLTTQGYMMKGILLPRDSDQQSRCGQVVTTEYRWEGLRSGDLLFFGRRAAEDEEERISHVAVYMGDTEFIHASGYRERVSINSMDSTRANYIEEYPGIFVRAVRIIGEESRGWERLRDNEFYRAINRDPS
jgi:uncharacterized protein YgiM (DUF1202 family)